MNKTTNKVVLIGSGQVGVGFMWTAITQGLAQEYVIIDLNDDLAKGNAYDFQDAQASMPYSYSIKNGGYEECKDADLIVITAGRPQRPGETRLDMVADNAKVMKNIAESVKGSGFSGVTVIASNPVDIMTTVFLKVTGYDNNKVISSGCVLDSARLKNELAMKFGYNVKDIDAHVMGEHGDSSFSALSQCTVNGFPMQDELNSNGLASDEERNEFHKSVFKRAYVIIEGKKYTNFGIGGALTKIGKSILWDQKHIMPVGVYLTGEYGHEGVHASIPAMLGKGGVIKTMELPLSPEEKAKFDNSVSVLKANLEVAEKAIS